MALDGITIANMVYELKSVLTGGRISKIAQPEQDELMITIKTPTGQQRLLLSAGASLPLIYLTPDNKPSPLTAPAFCMLLRKHIGSGRIVNITQPGLERIIRFDIEHLNDLGDLCTKQLIVELMGKHSNIIFCNEEAFIIDSIKHISAQISSIREVLPGRTYFIPNTLEKSNPLDFEEKALIQKLSKMPMPLYKGIYSAFTGFSPLIAEELCYRAALESARPANTFSEDELMHLCHHIKWMMDEVKEGSFSPAIYEKKGEPVDFCSIPLTQYADYKKTEYPSVSEVLFHYYASKNALTRIRQKSSDLRRIIQTALERNQKKYDLQLKQLKDTKKRDKYKVYGELINTYGYQLEKDAKSLEALNYYTNEMIAIPLDCTMSPQDNAKKYFQKYNKLKRTFEALSELTEETKAEIEHLESIMTSLDIAMSESDLTQIKEEMIQSGYIRRKFTKKKEKITSKPFHYISSDGFHIYVGKNNLQNDELTFQFAAGNDWWFHAKGIPGSHVIVKTNGESLPDRTFEEAGRLAAFYSKARGGQKVEIDYTEKKNVKKPNAGKPGFVVYYTNYSLMIDSDISNIALAEENES